MKLNNVVPSWRSNLGVSKRGKKPCKSGKQGLSLSYSVWSKLKPGKQVLNRSRRSFSSLKIKSTRKY